MSEKDDLIRVAKDHLGFDLPEDVAEQIAGDLGSQCPHPAWSAQEDGKTQHCVSCGVSYKPPDPLGAPSLLETEDEIRADERRIWADRLDTESQEHLEDAEPGSPDAYVSEVLSGWARVMRAND